MNANIAFHPSSLILHPLLPPLWLHEPDAETIARAVRELNLPAADPSDLAVAYSDVFLLNVPPYGTMFTDEIGELNGATAEWTAALFEKHGFSPAELREVAAPDHLGLGLAFWAHLTQHGDSAQRDADDFLDRLVAWAPVCGLAVEREPTTPPFYRGLAAATRQAILASCNARVASTGRKDMDSAHSDSSGPDFEGEVSLRALVSFFLTPAQCGLFVSRARLGRWAVALGMRLPFGSRYEVAEHLFTACGEAGRLAALLEQLQIEAGVWNEQYQAYAETYPAWQPYAEAWRARVAQALRVLGNMERLAAEYHRP